LQLFSQLAQQTHISTEFHALAMSVSTKATSAPVLLVQVAQAGMEFNVLLQTTAQMAMSSTLSPISASPQLHHAAVMLIGMVLHASAQLTTTLSTDNAKNAMMERCLMELNAQVLSS
jgi:hypothetical protein